MSKTLHLSDWEDDLIGCPSQCYSYFQHEGNDYCIYLRWRWDDPWTAHLLKQDPSKGENYKFIFDGAEWTTLKVRYWEEHELEELKKDAIECVEKLLLTTKNISDGTNKD